MENMGDRAHERGVLGAGFAAGDAEDPAACAARVIAEQALSIFEAAEARGSELEARARKEAEDVVGRAEGASVRTLAGLEAISRQLDALSAELAGRIEDRATTLGHGR